MIKKINLLRFSIISLLVIFFPLIQNQWLNLYLFDKYSFTIYKLLYYLSGLIFPFLVCFTSIRNFTYYEFNNEKVNNHNGIGGKLFLIIIVVSLLILSILFTSYIFLNLKLFFNLIPNDKYSLNYDVIKYISIVGIISILLLFKKVKLFFKKVILINFFIASFIIWVLKINNILIDKSFVIKNYLNIENINIINILFLMVIELSFFLWSYVSYGSNLSDWRVPKPKEKEFTGLLNILIFYLCITFYYSFLG